MGIGTTAPIVQLHVVENTNTLNGIISYNSNSGNAAGSRAVFSTDGSANTSIETMSSTFTDAGMRQANNGIILNNGNGSLNLGQGTTATTSAIRFFTNGVAAVDERMRIDNNGNVGIGLTCRAINAKMFHSHKYGDWKRI